MALHYWEFLTMFAGTNPGTPCLPQLLLPQSHLPLYIPSDPTQNVLPVGNSSLDAHNSSLFPKVYWVAH